MKILCISCSVFFLLFYHLCFAEDKVSKHPLSISVEITKSQEILCPEILQEFGFSELSEEAKNYVFVNFLAMSFPLVKLDDNNFKDILPLEQKLEDIAYQSASIEFKEGLRAGWVDTLQRFDEEKWKKILFLDSELFNKNDNDLTQIFYELNNKYGALIVVQSDESTYDEIFAFQNKHLSIFHIRGFRYGQRLANSQLQKAASELRNTVNHYIQSDMERIKRFEDISESESKERIDKIPILQAMIFLKKMYLRESKKNKLQIFEIMSERY